MSSQVRKENLIRNFCLKKFLQTLIYIYKKIWKSGFQVATELVIFIIYNLIYHLNREYEGDSM